MSYMCTCSVKVNKKLKYKCLQAYKHKTIIQTIIGLVAYLNAQNTKFVSQKAQATTHNHNLSDLATSELLPYIYSYSCYLFL